MPLPHMSDEQRHTVELADAERSLIEGLVSLRRESGVTASDVARMINRDKSTVSRFEALDGDPRLSTVFRYARAVGAAVSISVARRETPRELHRDYVGVWTGEGMSTQAAKPAKMGSEQKSISFRLSVPH